MACSVFLLLVVCLPFIINSQDRAFTNESPVPFSPEAYSFFHPKAQQQTTSNENLCDSSDCSEFPRASNVQSNLAYESLSPPEGGGIGLGCGGMTGIPTGFVFAILIAVGILFVIITRRHNSSNTNTAQLNA
ncbi:uncharacterized protein LOC132054022 [Lycium ferocissimum]|uniref:uncharacterized protein LOC132054022 n=1 Tax=Lycium ferocissimum TaxID=112874 RepID=UPI002816079F|nr:uncharacterized protein LOC132054022 [Lycium ferocissimum]